MENQLPNNSSSISPIQTAGIFGVIGGISSIILQVVLLLLGQSESPVGGIVGMIIFIVVIMLAIFAHRKALGNTISVGQGFMTGLMVALISGIIGMIWTLLYVYVINPEAVNDQLAAAREAMEKKEMSEDQIEEAMKFSAMFMQGWVLALTSLVGSVVLGALLSLVGAIIAKRQPTNI